MQTRTHAVPQSRIRVRLELGRDVLCPDCRGKGKQWKWGFQRPVKCAKCRGTGIVPTAIADRG